MRKCELAMGSGNMGRMSSLPQDRIANAREFYRNLLAREFGQARAFAASTRRRAEDIAATEPFETVLRECAPGSLDCARRIGEIAFIYLDTAPSTPGPWWRDLLNYERAVFLQSATTDPGSPANRPRRTPSALCMNFTWDIPRLLECMKSGERIPEELRRPLTLLFGRGADGMARVAEVGVPVEKVFRATNGLRPLEQIATAAAMSVEEAQPILDALAAVGAIAAAKSAEQITEILRQQGKT